tara:strand:+ start:1913 stop:2347 length:435 start_codon:yes stop_codon:yes gene_type:complete
MIELHSCSYFCERPACIKTQRDEMRDNGTYEQGEETYKEIRRACDEKLAAVTADLEHAQKRWEAELSTSAGWQHRAERVIKERDALGRQVADLQTEIAAIKSSETVAWLMEGNYGKFVSRQNAIADYRELDKDSIVTEIIRRPK